MYSNFSSQVELINNSYAYFYSFIPNSQCVYETIEEYKHGRSPLIKIENKCKCLIWISFPNYQKWASSCLLEGFIDLVNGVPNWNLCKDMIGDYLYKDSINHYNIYNQLSFDIRGINRIPKFSHFFEHNVEINESIVRKEFIRLKLTNGIENFCSKMKTFVPEVSMPLKPQLEFNFHDREMDNSFYHKNSRHISRISIEKRNNYLNFKLNQLKNGIQRYNVNYTPMNMNLSIRQFKQNTRNVQQLNEYEKKYFEFIDQLNAVSPTDETYKKTIDKFSPKPAKFKHYHRKLKDFQYDLEKVSFTKGDGNPDIADILIKKNERKRLSHYLANTKLTNIEAYQEPSATKQELELLTIGDKDTVIYIPEREAGEDETEDVGLESLQNIESFESKIMEVTLTSETSNLKALISESADVTSDALETIDESNVHFESSLKTLSDLSLHNKLDEKIQTDLESKKEILEKNETIEKGTDEFFTLLSTEDLESKIQPDSLFKIENERVEKTHKEKKMTDGYFMDQFSEMDVNLPLDFNGMTFTKKKSPISQDSDCVF